MSFFLTVIKPILPEPKSEEECAWAWTKLQSEVENANAAAAGETTDALTQAEAALKSFEAEYPAVASSLCAMRVHDGIDGVPASAATLPLRDSLPFASLDGIEHYFRTKKPNKEQDGADATADERGSRVFGNILYALDRPNPTLADLYSNMSDVGRFMSESTGPDAALSRADERFPELHNAWLNTRKAFTSVPGTIASASDAEPLKALTHFMKTFVSLIKDSKRASEEDYSSDGEEA